MADPKPILPTATPNRNPSTTRLGSRGRAASKSGPPFAHWGVPVLPSSSSETAARRENIFADGLRAAGHAILNEVVLNQVLVKLGDAQKTLAVVAALQRDGTCWCGSTVWQGRTAMRISVSSWATTDADVERSLRPWCASPAERIKPHRAYGMAAVNRLSTRFAASVRALIEQVKDERR